MILLFKKKTYIWLPKRAEKAKEEPCMAIKKSRNGQKRKNQKTEKKKRGKKYIWIDKRAKRPKDVVKLWNDDDAEIV